MAKPTRPRPIPWLSSLGDGTYQARDDHVTQVRRAFECYLAGWTAGEIAVELENTWTGRRDDAPAWDSKKVLRLLANEAVVGDWNPNKRLGAGAPVQRNLFPAVITRAEFKQANAMLRVGKVGLKSTSYAVTEHDSRGTSIAEVDLFEGLCYCDVCKNPVKPKMLTKPDGWNQVPGGVTGLDVTSTRPDATSTEWPVFVKVEHNRQSLLVAWNKTPQGALVPSVLKKSAKGSARWVYWECSKCPQAGDVPAFFIEDFLFEVVLRKAKLDLTKVFPLVPLKVARAAQLSAQRELLCAMSWDLGLSNEVEISRRLVQLCTEVKRIAATLPQLSLRADDKKLIERHKAFLAGKLTLQERELVRRRLWGYDTKVWLVPMKPHRPGDHQFALTGELVDMWKGKFFPKGMLVRLRDGKDLSTKPRK